MLSNSNKYYKHSKHKFFSSLMRYNPNKYLTQRVNCFFSCHAIQISQTQLNIRFSSLVFLLLLNALQLKQYDSINYSLNHVFTLTVLCSKKWNVPNWDRSSSCANWPQLFIIFLLCGLTTIVHYLPLVQIDHNCSLSSSCVDWPQLFIIFLLCRLTKTVHYLPLVQANLPWLFIWLICVYWMPLGWGMGRKQQQQQQIPKK